MDNFYWSPYRHGAIEVGGKSHRIMVCNVSESGAVLVEAVPGVAVGSTVVLTVDGLASSLAGLIARNDADGMLINVKLSDATRKLIGSLVPGQRAA